MVRFTLFGVPVTIEPWFWIATALLGGAIGADSQAEFLRVGIWILVALVSVLIHEFGHALVGRRLGGGYATIELNAFGGLAFSHGARFRTRWSRFWMIAAGPGAGFVFGLLVVAVLAVTLGGHDALVLLKRTLLFRGGSLSESTWELFDQRPFLRILILDLLWINFWWGFINLFPVYPLDGGQIIDLWVRPQKLVYQIGVGVGAALAIGGYVFFHSTYMAMLFGYLAYQNYQRMQQNRWV